MRHFSVLYLANAAFLSFSHEEYKYISRFMLKSPYTLSVIELCKPPVRGHLVNRRLRFQPLLIRQESLISPSAGQAISEIICNTDDHSC